MPQKRKSNSKTQKHKEFKKMKIETTLSDVCEAALKSQSEMKKCLSKVRKQPFVFRALNGSEIEQMTVDEWRSYASQHGYRMITASNSYHTNQIFYLPGEFPRVKLWCDLIFGIDAFRNSNSKNFIVGPFEITSNDYTFAMVASGFLNENQSLPTTEILLEPMINASSHLAGHIYGLKEDDKVLESAEERVFERALKTYKQVYCPTIANLKTSSCEK
jgi:hypothetical protein